MLHDFDNTNATPQHTEYDLYIKTNFLSKLRSCITNCCVCHVANQLLHWFVPWEYLELRFSSSWAVAKQWVHTKLRVIKFLTWERPSNWSVDGKIKSRYIIIALNLIDLTFLFFFLQGNFVHAGNILATQRLMRYHPGAHVCTHLLWLSVLKLLIWCIWALNVHFSSLPVLQVGMGTNKTLFALEDGYIRFTKEVYIPAPRSKEATQVITKLAKGTVLYKTFINVLPIKQEGKFKLVDMVWKGLDWEVILCRIKQDLVWWKGITCILEDFGSFDWY